MATEESQETQPIVITDKIETESKYDIIGANGYQYHQFRLQPIARILLMGVYDDQHILSTFRGMRYIIKSIWEFTLQFNKHHWCQFISYDKSLTETITGINIYGVKNAKYACQIDRISFPKPQNKSLNINMMPFIMTADFNKTKLPKHLKTYHQNLIIPCIRNDFSQHNKIGYLTIQESFVEKGKTQRRPGLHIETPGKLKCVKGNGECENVEYTAWWGQGSNINRVVDGIYMASNIDNTCALWNCRINSKHNQEVIGHLGDIEHLRDSLRTEEMMQIMEGNILYWITDRTPHESLPMNEDGHRQFFRLVTHNVSVWYEQHNTRNPNGVVPDKKITKIIKGNKFASQDDSNKNCTDCKVL